MGRGRNEREGTSHARGHRHVMQRGVDVIISGLVIVLSSLFSGKGPRAERQRSTGHIKHRDTGRVHLHPAETKGFRMVRES